MMNLMWKVICSILKEKVNTHKKQRWNVAYNSQLLEKSYCSYRINVPAIQVVYVKNTI